MKFSLSFAVLALAASQAMAVVPVPVKNCTKTVVVKPTDTGCLQFATDNGIKVEQLMAWNEKLRGDCANLDVGAPLCVSITPGAGGNSTAPAPVPTGAHTSVVPAPSGATTSGAGAAKPSASASAPIAGPPTKAANANNAVAGAQSSMVLAAAGVLVSVAYML
ncbi:hypothetical protein BGX28_000678 [Mortierella sp. GBA30]|nr:hypothetical protein BGX28_000678 [Mortierella sp. GBA30]